MYPEANVPVLQASLPTMDPATLFALGRALAPLRREGVLIVGSGFLTHNMRALDLRPRPVTPSWASEFDAWAAETLARRDVDGLLDYRRRAPGVRDALPSHEHFVPVVVAMGSALHDTGTPEIRFPITGFMAGSFTRRSVQLG
jgi:4,5-DOPA dioxygenase extradiol